MPDEVRPGIVYTVQPEPHDPEKTTWLEAGAVRFGLETREVDPARLRAAYADDPAALAEIEANQPEGGFYDSGVSIHVVGSVDGHEYLRFDLFEDDPHYHYVRPEGDHNHWVPFDSVAGGDFCEFALRGLRTRLAEMLRAAGGERLAQDLDAGLQNSVIDELENRIHTIRSQT